MYDVGSFPSSNNAKVFLCYNSESFLFAAIGVNLSESAKCTSNVHIDMHCWLNLPINQWKRHSNVNKKTSDCCWFCHNRFDCQHFNNITWNNKPWTCQTGFLSDARLLLCPFQGRLNGMGRHWDPFCKYNCDETAFASKISFIIIALYVGSNVV